MKKLLATVFAAAILVLTIGLTACGGYTVTFDGGGGVLVSGKESIEVRSGGKINIDDEPKYSKEGYVFIGWDVVLENIKSDITVTAQWRLIDAVVYNVVFNTIPKGGNSDLEVILPKENTFTVGYGEIIKNFPKGEIKNSENGEFLRWVIYIDGKAKEITTGTVFDQELLGTEYYHGGEINVYPVCKAYWIGPY